MREPLRGKFQLLAGFLDQAKHAPPMEWVLDQVVPDRGAVFIVAAPNVGKTWLALAIAKAANEVARVTTIVEEEGGLRALAARFTDLGFHSGASVFIAHQKGIKLDPQTVAELVQWISTEADPVLILDPLSALFDGDENETREAAALVESLRQLQRSNPRLLLVVLHHSSKAGARGEGPSLYAARGSSVFSGWCDTQLNLEGADEPAGSGRVSFFIEVTKQRDAEKAPRQKMTITLASEGDGGSIVIGAASEAAADDREKVVVAILNDRATGLSKNAICKAAGGRRDKALSEIDRLIRVGVCELTDRNLVRLVKPPELSLEETR